MCNNNMMISDDDDDDDGAMGVRMKVFDPVLVCFSSASLDCH